MLKENYDILKERYPFLLEEMENSEMTDCIWLGEAQNKDKILVINKNNRNWRLGSIIDPGHAAHLYGLRYMKRAFCIYFVFGLSDGRYVREMLKQYDKTNQIIVCEPDLAVFKKACETFNLADILKDERVHLYIPGKTQSVERIMKQNMQYADFKVMEFCILPGYDILYQKACEEFQDEILRKQLDDVIKRGTCIGFNRIVPQNTLRNMKNMIGQKNIYQLAEKMQKVDISNVPAILVSAGPSLDKNIKELKKAEGKALIIVVDAAIRTVVKAGIQPDIVCTIDPNAPDRFIDGVELGDAIWCCDRLTRPLILERYGKNIYYYGFFEEGWNQKIEELLPYPFPDLPSGGNVTSIALALACYLGFQKIILMGQDMAFTGGVSHTAGIQGALGENDAYIKSRYIMQVEGIDGEMLETDFQMWYYKQWFERAIRENKGVIEVINATEGGAKIEGAKNRRLCDVIAEECKGELQFLTLIKDVPSAFSEEQQQILRQELAMMCPRAEKLREQVKSAIESMKDMQESLDANPGNIENQKKCLRKVMQENATLETAPLFQMMSSYASRAEYEMGDHIYSDEDLDAAELVKRSLKLYEGYIDAVGMLLEDIEEFLES